MWGIGQILYHRVEEQPVVYAGISMEEDLPCVFGLPDGRIIQGSVADAIEYYDEDGQIWVGPHYMDVFFGVMKDKHTREFCVGLEGLLPNNISPGLHQIQRTEEEKDARLEDNTS